MDYSTVFWILYGAQGVGLIAFMLWTAYELGWIFEDTDSGPPNYVSTYRGY